MHSDKKFPEVIYNNSKEDKTRIFKENKNKRVVYRWVNKINNKAYIGSSINFSVRLYKYYSLIQLKKSKTPIHNALLKYGFENFSLEILEYCEEDVNPVLREQHYFQLLKPHYNILAKAGSLLGFKHSKDTLAKFAVREVSEETRKNLSLAAVGRILTEEDKIKISSKRKGIQLSDITRKKISLSSAVIRGIKIEVENVNTNEKYEFQTLTDAAKYLGVSRPAIKKALDNEKLIKKQYKITQLTK